MEDIYKEVFFDQYCPKCVHESKKDDEDPCYDCLLETVNLYSHKPVYFKKEKSKTRK